MMMNTPTKQTLSRNKLNSDDLFDESAGYEEETGVRLDSGLTAEEKQQANILYNLFNGLWGLCIIVGDPGTGKDLFGNYISYKIKKFFPWKRVLRDERPRRLFGSYAGLFNEATLSNDLYKMRGIATGRTMKEKETQLSNAADDWIQGAGEVMLKNSLLYLTEFWRYCYNRDPHNPMNKTMGAIHKTKRHLDCFILGSTQLVSDLDKKTCLPWIDWKVTCTRSVSNKTGFVYYVQKVKYDPRMVMLVPLGRAYPISFDAGKPRSDMGDGRIQIIKPYYKPENEEERIVLDVLKAGVNSYEEIASILEKDGDMSEREVLDALKELKFRKYKRVLDYPCHFGLYNSKSAPQLKTKVRVED